MAGPTGVPGSTSRVRYADHSDGFGDLSIPAGPAPASGWPVVVLVHGGFWRDAYALDLMEPLVPSLVERGMAVWNVEYRRVGSGGGHPETLADVAAAVDALAGQGFDVPLDLDRVAVVGHSAGGHLATWLASRHRLEPSALGASPMVRPVLAVSQAGVVDLVDGAEEGLGDRACQELLGGAPDEVPERYAEASPIGLLPIDARVVLVHGDADDRVPLRQSERYRDAAVAAGTDVRLVIDEGTGHFEHLDPDHPMWAAVLEELGAAGFSG